MIMSKSVALVWAGIMLTLCFGAVPTAPAVEGNLFDRAPRTASGGIGLIKFEGDFEVEDSFFLSLKAGHDFNVHWTLELGLDLMPLLEAREFNKEHHTDRFELQDDIWGLRLGADVLYHLRNTEDLHF